MTVRINDQFTVEIDKFGNHTLTEAYTGEDKDGNAKEAKRTHGYFRSMEGAIRKIITLQLARDVREVELSNYLARVEELQHELIHAFSEYKEEVE